SSALPCLDSGRSGTWTVVVNRRRAFIHEFRECPASGVIAPFAEARSAKQNECEDVEGQQYELRGFTELQRVIFVTTDLELDEDKRCDSDGSDQSCCNEGADQGPLAVPDDSEVEPDGHG